MDSRVVMMVTLPPQHPVMAAILPWRDLRMAGGCGAVTGGWGWGVEAGFSSLLFSCFFALRLADVCGVGAARSELVFHRLML